MFFCIATSNMTTHTPLAVIVIDYNNLYFST